MIVEIKQDGVTVARRPIKGKTKAQQVFCYLAATDEAKEMSKINKGVFSCGEVSYQSGRRV